MAKKPREKERDWMKIFAAPVLFIAALATGCVSNSELPVARNDFSGINLSGYENCKGVFLVSDVYDIGFGVAASGAVAQGEISVGDSASAAGKKIIISSMQAGEINVRKASKPASVIPSFGNQINVADLAKDDLLCFN